MFVSRRTKLGMALYAVGGNEKASRMMGLTSRYGEDWHLQSADSSLSGMLASAVYRPAHGRDAWETTAIAMCALGG